ncbi:MAG: S41 family peptidase [Pirellulaceae bacterium]
MTSFVRLLVVCIVLYGVTASSVARAQLQTAPASTPVVDANAVLKTGIDLEKKRQWIEAIQHYEAAVRSLPDHSEIRRRLLISRLHFDVVRRSSDIAVRDMISSVSEAQALDLYAEVLARLEMSYVEPLEMTTIVRGGTAYLEVALTEPEFIETHLANISADRIESFRTSIHRVTLATPVQNRFEARAAVAQAATVAQKSLGIRPTATIMQFVFGAVGLLDPYSSFLSSAELNEVESQIEGNFVGLGIALQPHEAPLRILNVIPGGPAIEAGLESGDLILEIGSVNCEDVGAERAADLLRGPEQSHVRLLVKKANGSLVDQVVARRRVEVPSIENVHMADPSAGVAYLKISSFQKTTADELDDALWKLHHQGMQSLILDLRGNPGGWLDASVAVADRFLAEGGIVSTRGKNGIENQNYTANRSGTWQVPLVVLIDDQSASASEILAGAIRDNRRGTLVGETSFGKGSVQGLFHTKSLGSGIRLTVSKFYSPSGRAISEQGVQPNIIVTDEPSTKNANLANQSAGNSHFVAKVTGGDEALRVAIEHARSRSLSAAATVARN